MLVTNLFGTWFEQVHNVIMDDSSSKEGEFQTFTPSQDPAQQTQQTRGITHVKKLIKKRSDEIKESIKYNQ